MILEFSLIALFILTLAAVSLRDLLHAVIVLAGADAALAVVFYLLAAPDIAITQAAVGSGLTTIIFLVAIYKTRRVEE